VLTQQYIVGERSVLVGDFCPPCWPRLAATVKQLPQELSDMKAEEIVKFGHAE
jgi:hypothetical protein